MNAVNRVNTGQMLLKISNGASVSPAQNIPDGTAIVGIRWPNLRNAVKIQFLDLTSATAGGRLLRKSGGLDSTSNVGCYLGTAASAAGCVFVPDLAGSNFFKIALTTSLTSARNFHIVFKS